MVRERKIEVMHDDLQNWKSYLRFIEDEMVFIQRLLDSYVFEPRTPNLFGWTRSNSTSILLEKIENP